MYFICGLLLFLKNDAAQYDQLQHNGVDNTTGSETEPIYEALRALLWRINHFKVMPTDLLFLYKEKLDISISCRKVVKYIH